VGPMSVLAGKLIQKFRAAFGVCALSRAVALLGAGQHLLIKLHKSCHLHAKGLWFLNLTGRSIGCTRPRDHHAGGAWGVEKGRLCKGE